MRVDEARYVCHPYVGEWRVRAHFGGWANKMFVLKTGTSVRDDCFAQEHCVSIVGSGRYDIKFVEVRKDRRYKYVNGENFMVHRHGFKRGEVTSNTLLGFEKTVCKN